MSIWVLDPIHDAGPLWLEDKGHHVVRLWTEEHENTDKNEARALIVRTAIVDSHTFERFPNVTVIGKHGVGVDNIDVSEASRRGITITNTPEIGANAVAEHAVMLLLAASRRLVAADEAVRDGDFDYRYRTASLELTGRSLGLIGAGNIGQRIAQICRSGFEMQIGIYDPFVSPEVVAALEAFRANDVRELFEWSDAVVIAAPRTEKTDGMVGAHEIEALGSEGVLVCVSRGGIVDEEALSVAIRSDVIWGAGVDVFAIEPPAGDNSLLRQDRVVLSPHIAGGTVTALQNMSLSVARNVNAVLHGEEAPLI